MSIVICLYIILPILCLIGVQKNDLIEPALTKDATVSIRGIGMLLIIFAHAIGDHIVPETFFFYVSAILGVSACFLVSGYGLYKSHIRTQNYMHGFLVLKFSRCLIPYFILYILYLLVSAATGTLPTLSHIGTELITLRMDGLLLWYLKIQLLLYIFFWIVFRFIASEKLRLPALFVFVLVYILIAWRCGIKSHWYNTCLFFPLGILMAKYEVKILTFCRTRLVLLSSFALLLGLFGVIYLFGRLNMDWLIDNAYMLAFNILLVGLFQILKNSKLLYIIGTYSMEIYLVHLLLLTANPFQFFNPTKGISYLILLALTILISLPVYTISNALVKRIRQAVQ